MPGRYEGSVLALTGRRHESAIVEVRIAGTTVRTGGLFADGDGEFSLLNPLPVVTPEHAGVDLSGRIIFYADPALTYDIWVINGYQSFGPYNVSPAADVDASSVVIDGGSP